MNCKNSKTLLGLIAVHGWHSDFLWALAGCLIDGGWVSLPFRGHGQEY